ncbi:MAG: transposase [Bryobacterales bacterium]
MSRWLLLKCSENLGDEQHFRLRDLLRYNLKTVRLYLLNEAFHAPVASRLNLAALRLVPRSSSCFRHQPIERNTDLFSPQPP